jgi:hypothetical protein
MSPEVTKVTRNKGAGGRENKILIMTGSRLVDYVYRQRHNGGGMEPLSILQSE